MKYTNKYSNKIYQNLVSYIKKYELPKIYNISSNGFIQKVNAVINKVLSDSKYIFAELPNKMNLSRLHEVDQPPLLYIYFKQLHEENIFKINDSQIENFLNFANWFSLSQHDIDYDKIFANLKRKNNPKLLELHNLIFTPEKNRQSLHDLIYANTFVSLDIQQHAESTELTKIKITNEDFNLDLYYGSDILDPLKELNEICKIILIMGQIAKGLNVSNLKNPQITIFLGKQKKYISNQGTVLCAENINSGSTIRNLSVGIWRFEEYKKVLIHELIHFYGIDFSYGEKNYGLVSDAVKKNILIKGNDFCNEPYTEVIALIINCCYYSIKHNLDVGELFKNEIYFSIYQVAKIVCHFGGQNMVDLPNKKITILQNTSVTSYFIIKLCLLYNIENFLKLALETNLKCSVTCTKLFAELINESCKIFFGSKEINSLCDKMIEDLKAISIYSFPRKTMRMTLTE